MFEAHALKAATVLEAGGVVLAPTDTVYGLMASPGHAAAQVKIYRLKRRPTNMNLQLLCPDNFDLKAIGAVISLVAAELFLNEHLRPKITFILPLDPLTKPDWLAHREEVGLRVPAASTLQAMLEKTGPVFATSANAHGKKPGKSIADILPQLDGSPDYIWDAGELSDEASSVINFNNDPPLELRRGAAGDLSRFGVDHG